MSDTMRLTDELIRAALRPADDLRVPADLGDEIRASIDATDQRAAPLLALPRSPRSRLLVQLVLIGLLVLAVVGASLLIASRRTEPPPPLEISTYRGGPERTAVMPGPAPVKRPAVEWTSAVFGAVGSGTPVVLGGVVYVGDEGGYVTALDEASGRILWSHAVGAPINDGISVSDGVLVVGDDAGVVHGLDLTLAGAEAQRLRASGAQGTDPHLGLDVERWNYQAGGPVHSSAVIADGVVYVASLSGTLAALDLKSGRQLWPHPVMTADSVSRSIAFENGVIYVGSGGPDSTTVSVLAAYDAASGSRKWSNTLSHGNTSTVSLSGGRVFVTSGLDGGSADDQVLAAFDATTGKSDWSFAAPSRATLLTCAIAQGLVFACGDDRTLYAVDAATGLQEWNAPTGATQSPGGGFVGRVVYITSDDEKVHAIDASSGRDVWTPIPVPGVPTSPAIIDGRIIVGTSLGKVVSLAVPRAGGEEASSANGS
jgi:outer membrane protein assembly factor BamB